MELQRPLDRHRHDRSHRARRRGGTRAAHGPLSAGRAGRRLAALVAYYRAFEAAPPDFAATARIGGRDLAAGAFRGRTTTAVSTRIALEDVAAAIAAATGELVFEKDGTGTLYYGARVR